MGISTHVLDTSLGRPAAGVPIFLEAGDASGSFVRIGHGQTDPDGRLKTLLGDRPLHAGDYRITFDTRTYFAHSNTRGFYPSVSIVFTVEDAAQHFHVPLLISPYGYSTYRGS